MMRGKKKKKTKLKTNNDILPFFATESGICEQVVPIIALCRHPMLIISSSDTVQFIDQIREPASPVTSLDARIRRCITR